MDELSITLIEDLRWEWRAMSSAMDSRDPGTGIPLMAIRHAKIRRRIQDARDDNIFVSRRVHDFLDPYSQSIGSRTWMFAVRRGFVDGTAMNRHKRLWKALAERSDEVRRLVDECAHKRDILIEKFNKVIFCGAIAIDLAAFADATCLINQWCYEPVAFITNDDEFDSDRCLMQIYESGVRWRYNHHHPTASIDLISMAAVRCGAGDIMLRFSGDDDNPESSAYVIFSPVHHPHLLDIAKVP